MAGVSLTDAVRQAAITLGLGQTEAKTRIIAACLAGLIQAYWRGEYANRNPPILRREWAGADIDVRNDVLILADGTRKALVVLDRQEFEAWLKKSTSPSATLKRGKGPRKKRKLCEKAALDEWGPEGPPEHLTNPQICQAISGRLNELQPPAPFIDDRTMLRAVGRLK